MGTQAIATNSPFIAFPSNRRATPKRKLFVQYYLGEANRNATRAAELAGFGSPRVVGSQIRRQLKDVIEAEELKLAEASKMSAVETIEILTEIARDPTHKDRVRCCEIMAKIHGLLNEKLNITLDRKGLQSNVMESMGALAALAARKQPQLPPAKSA